MNISLESLEEALLIRRQIGTLKKRLASLLGTALSRSAFKAGGKWMSAATRAKLSAAAKHAGQSQNVPASAKQRERKANSHQRDERDFPN
jgi:hypothetical protein